VESIRQQIEEATSDYDTEKLRTRCQLSGGVAVIKVVAANRRRKLR